MSVTAALSERGRRLVFKVIDQPTLFFLLNFSLCAMCIMGDWSGERQVQKMKEKIKRERQNLATTEPGCQRETVWSFYFFSSLFFHLEFS